MREEPLEYAGDILVFSTTLMKQKIVLTTEELEQEVYQEFYSKFTPRHLEKMPNSRRTRWQNLVDWCKANWTRTDKTIHLVLHSKKYIVWMPSSGVVHNSTVYDGAVVSSVIKAIESKFPC